MNDIQIRDDKVQCGVNREYKIKCACFFLIRYQNRVIELVTIPRTPLHLTGAGATSERAFSPRKKFIPPESLSFGSARKLRR